MGPLNKKIEQRELEKLKYLLGIHKKLKSSSLHSELDKIILPIQLKAIEDSIRETIDYLRRWGVLIRINDEY